MHFLYYWPKINRNTPRAFFKDNSYSFAISMTEMHIYVYVLSPYIIYIMQSRRFSQSPAFLSWTAKKRDKKYIVKWP
jgi:hypothetical protein